MTLHTHQGDVQARGQLIAHLTTVHEFFWHQKLHDPISEEALEKVHEQLHHDADEELAQQGKRARKQFTKPDIDAAAEHIRSGTTKPLSQPDPSAATPALDKSPARPDAVTSPWFGARGKQSARRSGTTAGT